MKERTTAGYVEDVKLILAHGVILYRIECRNKFQISLGDHKFYCNLPIALEKQAR